MQVQKERSLSIEAAVKYLNLYNGKEDWEQQLGSLWRVISKKVPNQIEAKDFMRQIIACSILLPFHEKSAATDPKYKILFWCHRWDQFKSRDWVDLLWRTIDRDEQIQQWRNEALSLGLIKPIEYSLTMRQGYNWLYKAAEKSGAITDENKHDIKRKLQNLLFAYGGTVVCNIFTKESNKIAKKVPSWETNYFFERLIFDVYDIEQVLKIKKHELFKTNSRLVKQVRVD